MTMTDLDPRGTDGATLGGGIDLEISLTSGRQLLSQDLIARLLESPGGLYYDPEYGGGVADLVNESMDKAEATRVGARILAQCLADPRVLEASVSSTLISQSGGLILGIRIVDSEGPFELICDVAKASISLLGMVN